MNRSALRSALIGLAALVVMVSLISCGAGSGGSAGSSDASGSTVTGPFVQAKFADLQALHTATTDSAMKFAQLVSQYTGGRVKITVYPNSELGTSNSILQGLEADTIQFYATPDLSAVVPETDVIELPYLFPSAQVASQVLNGPVANQDIWDRFKSHGLQVLGVWSIGYSALLTTDQAVNAPADVQGLRIRIFDTNVGQRVWSALHADGITLPSNQVVTALSTHTIDGADDPPSTMYGSDWYGSAHHLAITNMTWVSSPVVVNSAFFSKLSPSEQAAVQRALQATLTFNMNEAQQTADTAVSKMQAAGIAITHPDVSVFRQALQPVYTQVEAAFPNVVQPLQQAVQQAPSS